MIDGQTIFLVLMVSLIGAVIGLDRTAVGQFMVSQPIVAGPLTGWFLGDAAAGLVIGAVLELIWVLDLPVGTFVPADSTVAAVSATAIAAIGSGPGPAAPDVIGFSILLTTAMAPVTMEADRFIRGRNARLFDWALSAPAARTERMVALAHGAGIAVFFLKFLVLYIVLIPAGLGAVALFREMPERVHAAMALYTRLLPVLGAALIVRRLSFRAADSFLLIGFATALAVSLLLRFHPAIAVALAAGAGWLGVLYQGRRGR